jgi:hypothetical protein
MGAMAPRNRVFAVGDCEAAFTRRASQRCWARRGADANRRCGLLEIYIDKSIIKSLHAKRPACILHRPDAVRRDGILKFPITIAICGESRRRRHYTNRAVHKKSGPLAVAASMWGDTC